jgi:predicted enzyme related to lactoylglutathione lyase
VIGRISGENGIHRSCPTGATPARPSVLRQNRAMNIRLRQVALVAADLGAAEGMIERELGLDLCYRDPGVAGFGLTNALYPIGDKLLEVISPSQDGTTAGRLLDKRGGDGGYMVIFQVDDLDEMRRRFDAAGARVVFEAVDAGVTGLHLHPRDLGGAIVSVDQTEDWAAWPWAGPAWRDHVEESVVTDIVGVEIEAEDPSTMAARWAGVLGVDRAQDTVLEFAEGSVRFVPAGARGEGMKGIDLAGSGEGHRQLEICGTTVQILPAR